MKTDSAIKPAAIAENVSRFESDIANADTVRASALSGLQRLRVAKANYAEREQARIAAKLGENHADVVRLKAEVAENTRFGQELSAEINRTTAASPAADKRGWSLYGFVRTQDLQGQPNLTVALFDRTARWIEALGHACTDSRGYFQLRYAPGGSAPATDHSREIFIRVTNRKQEVLYRDKKPMSAIPGEIKYREIVLDDESPSCSPPSNTPPKVPASSKESSVKSQKARPTKKVRKGKKH
jgi:hypothetical protein